MEAAEILSALWTLQQHFENAVVLSLHVFERKLSYLLLLRRPMLHIFLFRCQNCNIYCVINIAKTRTVARKFSIIGALRLFRVFDVLIFHNNSTDL